MYWSLSLLCLFLLNSSWVEASWNFESDNLLQGINRDFPQGASRLSHINEVFFESSSGVRYQNEQFQFEAKALIRSLQSPSNGEKGDFSFVQMDPPARLFKLYQKIGKDESQNQTVLDTGTLWASYNIDHWQFTAGRRPVGIGVLKVFPVWNRFYPVIPSISGYMFVNNPDMLNIQWSKNQLSLSAYSIFSQYYDDSVNVIEMIHYGDNLESHFIAGNWWNQLSIGYAGVIDLPSGIYRLETLMAAENGDRRQGGIQFGVGWERAISEKMSLLAEYYHSSYGSRKVDDYLLQDPTPFRNLLGTDYFFPQISYKLSDFFAADLGVIMNLIDGSSMLVSNANYSLADNMSLVATIRNPLGGALEEFGHLKVPLTKQRVEYVHWISLALKFTF